MRRAVRGLVRRADVLRGPPPDVTVAVRPAHAVLLVVDGPEEGVPCDTGEEDGCKIEGAGLDGVQAEVLCLEGVSCGEKAETPPGQVKAVVVVRDVDCAQVPGFVDEEVQDVKGLENGYENQRGRNMTVLLVLVGNG